MKADLQLLAKMENLAFLCFLENERDTALKDINEALDAASVILECDVAGVAPLVHVRANKNVFRDDTVNQTVSREEILACAPDRLENYYVAPQTFD